MRQSAPPPTAAPARAPAPPRARASELDEVAAGTKIRIVNRRGWRHLPDGFVELAGVQYEPRRGDMPGGYRVLMRTPDGVRPYVDVLLHPNATFELGA